MPAMKSLGPLHAEPMKSKLFAAFISLTLAMEPKNKLRDLTKRQGLGIRSVTGELEKIRLMAGDEGKKIMNPLTETQEEIFRAFVLGLADVKAYAQKNV
jgi:hypothetical protein